MTRGIIVEPDDRGRVSLAKLPGENAERYLAQRLPDGGVLLQPAVVLTAKAIESLLKLQSEPLDKSSPGRPLGEVLDRLGRRPLDPAVVESVQLAVAERRKRGVRSVADLTPAEIVRLRGDSPFRPEASSPT
jgi:hypothetical protein